MSRTVPFRRVLGVIMTSWTNVPSVSNTWMRLFPWSHTYTRSSLDTSAQVTKPANPKQNGNFGVFTDTTAVGGKATFGTDAQFYLWNNMTATTTTLPTQQSSIWWLFLLQGIAAIVLGLMLLTAPGATLVLIVTFLGFYWLIEGILALVHVFVDRSVPWIWSLLTGLVGIAAGVLGALATTAFFFATGKGDLSLVAVLTSLYPAVTIILARAFLAEHWSRMQRLGLLAAAGSVLLISVGSAAS